MEAEWGQRAWRERRVSPGLPQPEAWRQALAVQQRAWRVPPGALLLRPAAV